MSDLFSPRFAPPPPPPPPAPPLPPQRYVNRATNAIARLVAQPFIGGSRPPSAQANRTDDLSVRNAPSAARTSIPLSSQTATHKTGIPISAVDISPQRTHAVLAGREILKTIRVEGANCAEEFNLRAAISAYSSTHHAGALGSSVKPKDDLAANDVKWSHGNFSSTIATAAPNGRIVLYDINRAGVELARLHEHHRQVHKLAFNPHQGYYLLSGSQDTSLRLWDLRAMAGGRSVTTFRSSYKYNANSESVRDVKWSPTDGTEFACATDAGFVQRWDFRRSNAPLLRLSAHRKPCHSIDWHPDGKHLVSGGMDKMVMVWDFSSFDRRQKPTYSYRAPQAVMNVRWRPVGWNADSHGSGSWETTQLVTSYRDLDPRIHLWDFRRSTVPFREIDRYSYAPTDMLWHSDNLLWTVGFEGMFTQTDIHFAPRVAARRNAQAFDVASDGELSFFTQERLRRRGSAIDSVSDAIEISSVYNEKISSDEKLSGSRSVTDDDGSGNLLSSSFKRRDGRGWSARSSKSVGNTPPSEGSTLAVTGLDETLSKNKPANPIQSSAQGHLPDALNVPTYAYLADEYRYAPVPPAVQHVLPVNERLVSAMKENAKVARSVGMYRLSQTWEILALVLMREKRISMGIATHDHAADVTDRNSLQPGSQQHLDANTEEEVRATKENLKVVNPAIRAISVSEGGGLGPGTTGDSTSNMATPLARPLPDSPLFQDNSSLQSSLDDDLTIMLPPPVLSSTPHRYIDERERVRSPSTSHDSPKSSHIPTSPWPDQSIGFNDSEPRIERHRPASRPPLTLDPPRTSSMARSPNSQIQRFESQESFPMFSASTDSSNVKQSFPGSYDSFDNRGLASKPDSWNDTYYSRGFSYEGMSIPARHRTPSSEKQTVSQRKIGYSTDSDLPLARHSTPLHKQPVRSPNPPLQALTTTILSSPPLQPSESPSSSPHPTFPFFSLSSLLSQLIPYHLTTLADPLTPITLLLLLAHLPPTTRPAISRNTVLSIIQTHHTTLLSLRLHNSATHLRRVTCPTTPSQLPTPTTPDPPHTLSFLCPSSHPLPLNTPPSNCRKCHPLTPQTPCPLCHTPPRVGLRWAWCQACGHGAHAVCAEEWWGDAASGGGCPVPACGCDCVKGEKRARREERRVREREKGEGAKVKRDEWVADERPAVGGARGGLLATSAVSVGSSSGGGGGKKVKVVAPTEQGG
ncbi:MAG: SEA (Seh1-associated) complex subunit [Piccolia ochrophora]|nr:MAG: SEA (Seh1-associated) complex subunit [Piccolia ochrophora]